MRRSASRAAGTVALAVAVVVAAAVLVRLLLSDGGVSGVSGSSSAASGDAVVVSRDTAEEVRRAAEHAAEQVLGYHWQTLDEDVEGARALLTGEVREQYDATMARAAGPTRERRTVVEATAVASSVVSVTEDEAKALLFVNQHTTTSDAARPRAELNRVVLTLQLGAGGWQVAELDVL